MKLSAIAALSVFALSQVVSAQSAVQWRVEDGGNGHWYLASANRMTFPVALAWAQSVGGHLATIESAAENARLFDLARTTPGAWITTKSYFEPGPVFGLQQLATNSGYSEPSGGWTWVTGEPYGDGFRNFCDGQPDNNSGGGQSVGCFYGGAEQHSCWDDIFDATQLTSLPWTFLVEWDADCNNDGIVDYGQIRAGLLADADADTIPDSCEPVMQGWMVLADSAADFSSQQGFRGWRYRYDTGASSAVNEMQYYLPAALPVGDAVWCVDPTFGPGGTNCSIGQVWMHTATNSECTSPGRLLRPRRIWSSSSPVSGRVSLSGSFLSHDGMRSRLTLLVDGVVAFEQISSGATTDINDWERIAASVPIANCHTVELIEDPQDDACHADGTLCLVQVIVEDCNQDGIPDSCTLHVPQDYPTIQAAIDSVSSGQHKAILVAAGTYHESFSLNGKDVVVRGAANNATILDGTVLAGSIARFTGGEPATAGVEGLVFRNGTNGSLIYPGAPFDVGGAIYGASSSAGVRNCRFEGCSADYGGAMYLIYSGSSIEGCVFDSNRAINEGGGLFLYESSSRVANCAFTGNDTSVKGPGAGSAFKAVGARATGEVVELTGCTFTGNRAILTASAIEYYENIQSHPGVLRISGCTVTGNSSGLEVPDGAAGLRVFGRNSSCVITGGTTICSNTPKNTAGPFLIEGSANVCGCFADLTGDGLVNGGDLGVLLGAWGIAGPAGVGDANHDGLVNAADLSLVLGGWGACP